MLNKPSSYKNFSEVLVEKVKSFPNKTAYEFLNDDNSIKTLSYFELHQHALGIAEAIKKRCKKGDRVILLFPPSEDFIKAFWGCIYAGVIAVPCALPMHKSTFSSRLKNIIDSCSPSLYLTNNKIYKSLKRQKINLFLKKIPFIRSYTENFPDFSEIESIKMVSRNAVLLTDMIKPIASANLILSEPDDTLFLQYTSGSTNVPKGVIVTHNNVLENAYTISNTLELNEDTKGFSWLPPYHDMGLVGFILLPVYPGFSVRLMPTLRFIRDPLLWLEQIQDFHADLSGGPNFAFDLCNRYYDANRLNELDLSCWQKAFCGSETIHYNTLKQFLVKYSEHKFKTHCFLPCYGLAESTLYVTGIQHYDVDDSLSINHAKLQDNIVSFEDDSSQSMRIISCGINPNGQKLKIVNTQGEELSSNQIGKIVISSQSVGKGYWNNDKASTFFHFHVKNNNEDYLDTGDLGFIHNDQLYVVGREKEAIIIHGKNYHPQWIEKSIQDVSPIVRKNCIAVLQIPEFSLDKIIVVLEIYDDKIDNIQNLKSIALNIFRYVYENFELQIEKIYFLKKDSFIKTTSGKIPRKVISKKLLDNTLTPLYMWQNFSGISSSSKTDFDHKLFSSLDEKKKMEYLLHFTQALISNLHKKDVTKIKSEDKLIDYINDSLIQLDFLASLEESVNIEITPASINEEITIAQFTAELMKLIDQTQSMPK